MVLFLEHFLGSFCWQSYLSLSSLIDYNSYNDLASDACFLSTLYNDNQKDYYYSTFYTLKAIKASKASSCCPIVVSLSHPDFNSICQAFLLDISKIQIYSVKAKEEGQKRLKQPFPLTKYTQKGLRRWRWKRASSSWLSENEERQQTSKSVVQHA